MQSQFPSEWCSVACEQFVVDPKADIVDGPFGSNLKASEYTDSGVPIARIQNVKRFKFIDKNIRFVTSTKAEELKRHSFIGGDILVTKLGDPLGLACEVPNSFDSGIIVADLVRLRANTSVCSNKFMIYLLNSPVVIAQLEKHIKGTTRPRINLGIIRGLALPLPPLAEQEEIAHRLETMLDQVESTQARLARIPDIIKRFRQSVLAAAVSGKLTEEWRELNKGVDQWRQLELKEAAEIIDPHPSHRTPKVVDGGVPYIGIGDLRLDGSIDFENARKVSFDILKEHNERYTLKTGDFIFGKIGTLGKATILPIGIDYTLSANVILIQPIEHIATPEYLQFFLSSPSTLNEIAKQANSTSQAAFGIKKMRTFQCKLPNKEEQNEIVRRVEQLFAYADTIEQQAKTAKERVDKLTQAILAKAFRGELTADWRAANPELISGENSAAALLAGIQAERATAKPRKRASKPAAINPTLSGVTQ